MFVCKTKINEKEAGMAHFLIYIIFKCDIFGPYFFVFSVTFHTTNKRENNTLLGFELTTSRIRVSSNDH